MSLKIVGREPELGVAHDFLDRIRGGPAVLLVEGEAGIGKTTVWAEIVRIAAERGYEVLHCRASTSEASLAFVGLTDLATGVAADVFDELPRPQREALDAALLRSDPREGAPDQRAVSTGFLTLLGALAERSPVVIAVDDAQWQDRPSARVLEFASRRLGEQPVGILASSRPDAGQPGFVRMAPEGRVLHLHLGPLSLGALYRLVDERLGLSLPRPLLLKVEAVSGGNPMFALEIARVLQLQGLPSPGDPLPVPDSLAELVSTKIDALPVKTRDAVLVAAALSRPTTDIVDRVALEAAEAAGVVAVRDGLVEFTHPLFAAAAYAAASRERRQQLHHELAALVPDIEERARHLMLATEGPDEQIADALHDAAEHADRRGAPETAAELEEESVRRTASADPTRRSARLLRAAEHYIQAGDGDRAWQLAEEVLAASPPPALRADALHLMAETCYRRSPLDAVPLLQEALVCAEGDSQREVQIGHSLAFVCMATGNLPEFDRHTRRVVELAESLGETALLGEALGLLAACDFFLGRGFDEAVIRRALELEDPERRIPVQVRPSMQAAWLYEFTGNFEASRSLFVGLRRRVLERGEESDLPFVALRLAATEYFAGDLLAALEHAQEAVDAADLVATEVLRGFALVVRALVRGTLGDIEQGKVDAHESVEICERNNFPHGAFGARWALAIFALLEDEPTRAWEALAPVVDAVEAFGVYDRATGMYLPEAIEALVSIGDLERAERLTASLDDVGRRLGRPWALATASRCRGLVLAARKDLDGASAALGQALVEHERLPMPLELGYTLLHLGRLHRRRKQKRLAKQALERALEVFEGIGAVPWAEKARAELSRVGLRPAAPDELTETERRVADLAASGLTNKQVAAQAFLTPKSVEDVLARVYRKLDIHSRAELGAKMAALPRD